MRIDRRRGELKNMSGFFVKHHKGKKEKIQKNKVTKTYRREKFEKRNPPTRKLTKNGEIFLSK